MTPFEICFSNLVPKDNYVKLGDEFIYSKYYGYFFHYCEALQTRNGYPWQSIDAGESRCWLCKKKYPEQIKMLVRLGRRKCSES